jgi:hypothetical protein
MTDLIEPKKIEKCIEIIKEWKESVHLLKVKLLI